MGHTNTSNENSENDISDMEIKNMADGDRMTNIRDNIADMLWANH